MSLLSRLLLLHTRRLSTTTTSLSSTEKICSLITLLKTEKDPHKIISLCKSATLSPASSLHPTLHTSPDSSTTSSSFQDVNLLNALLSACVLARDFKEMTRVYLEFMRIYEIVANLETYNCVVKGYSESSVLEEMGRHSSICFQGFTARGVTKGFENMVKRGFKPDCDCYYILAYCLCKGGDFESAFRFAKGSIAKNWVPNFATMMLLVEGLVSIGKVAEARGCLSAK